MTKGKKQEPSFEEDLKKLTNLVSSLENQNLDLDEAIKTYKEGVDLSQRLAKRLAEAEAMIEMISVDSNTPMKPESSKAEFPVPPNPFLKIAASVAKTEKLSAKKEKSRQDNGTPFLEDPEEEDDDSVPLEHFGANYEDDDDEDIDDPEDIGTPEDIEDDDYFEHDERDITNLMEMDEDYSDEAPDDFEPPR